MQLKKQDRLESFIKEEVTREGVGSLLFEEFESQVQNPRLSDDILLEKYNQFNNEKTTLKKMTTLKS